MADPASIFLTTAKHMLDESERDERRAEIARQQQEKEKQRKQEENKKIEREQASRRAKKYAGGYSGSTYNQQMENIRKRNTSAPSQRIYSGGGNSNRINLFKTVLDKMVKK